MKKTMISAALATVFFSMTLSNAEAQNYHFQQRGNHNQRLTQPRSDVQRPVQQQTNVRRPLLQQPQHRPASPDVNGGFNQDRPVLKLLGNAAVTALTIQNEINIANQRRELERLQQAQQQAQLQHAQQQAQIQAQQQAWLAQQQKLQQQAAIKAQQSSQWQGGSPHPTIQSPTQYRPDYRGMGNVVQVVTGHDVNKYHRETKKEWDEFRNKAGIKTPKAFKKIANWGGW